MGDSNNSGNARLMFKFCHIKAPIARNRIIIKILTGRITTGEPRKTKPGLKILFMNFCKYAFIPCDREH